MTTLNKTNSKDLIAPNKLVELMADCLVNNPLDCIGRDACGTIITEFILNNYFSTEPYVKTVPLQCTERVEVVLGSFTLNASDLLDPETWSEDSDLIEYIYDTIKNGENIVDKSLQISLRFAIDDSDVEAIDSATIIIRYLKGVE